MSSWNRKLMPNGESVVFRLRNLSLRGRDLPDALVDCDVTISMEALAEMARQAAYNKSGRSVDGALTVRVVEIKEG
jgi:hypothetical protein